MNPYALIIAQNARDPVTAALTQPAEVNATVAGDVSYSSPAPLADQNAQKLNPIPYVKTDAVGVKLSGTEMEGMPDATEVNSLLTRQQIEDYTKGTLYGIKAIESVSNGYLANASYEMKAKNEEWKAKQNGRSAKLLLANQREINRAAQADANVYKLEGAQTKSKQKVAMAASGFAVGKGIYRTTLDTTDVRTNYNTSAIMLRAALQNAELVRKAGNYEAEAIINRANADINRKLGETAVKTGWADGIAYAAASAAYFYVGKHPYTAQATKTSTNNT